MIKVKDSLTVFDLNVMSSFGFWHVGSLICAYFLCVFNVIQVL